MSLLDTPPWRRFLCRACGLVYDEEQGDPDSGLAPGTRFEDIPDDWECPLCGVTKSDFEPLPEVSDAVFDAVADEISPRSGRAREGIVIVGAGVAGWSAAEAIRAIDPYVPVTLVTACSGDRYHKPEISVALGRGVSPSEMIRNSAAEAAGRLGIHVMTGTFVTGISPGSRQVRTTRSTLRYTKLVLALGARPALPAALPPQLCWRVNDFAGWQGLHGRLTIGPKRVAIIGAGMVGVELAEDFAKAGHAVTLVDVRAEPLLGLLPLFVAQRLRRALEALGCTFVGSARIARIEAMPHGGRRVVGDDGADFEVDEVVAATGLNTESRLARSAGIAFNNGIAVDAHSLQTSVPDIYSLGDCISIDGKPCRFIEPIARQASALAHHALGRLHPAYAHGTPVVRLKNKTFPVVVHGMPRADGVWRATQDGDGEVIAEQWIGDQLIARVEAGRATSRRAA